MGISPILRPASQALALLSCCFISHSAQAQNAQAQNALAPQTQLQAATDVLSKPDFKPGLIRLGDMLVSRSSLQSYAAGLKTKSSDGKQNIAAGFQVGLWPGGKVPYVFDPGASSNVRNFFLKAIQEWPKYAGVTWVPRTNEANYVRVFTDPTAVGFSYSALGMTGGAQDLSIDATTAAQGDVFIIVHELGHALGMSHEHQRSDRDQYITINSSNISEDNLGQFTLETDSDNLTAYDFDSIMHYDQFSFAKDESVPTMICKPAYKQFQATMGQTTHISELDKVGMLKKYPFPASSKISVNTASVVEGDTGAANAVFTVTLKPASTKVVTVSYATDAGTATSGTDFVATSGKLTFAAGETTKTVVVPVRGDTAVEANETFNFNIFAPVGASIGDGTGKGTIIDDDAVPTLSVAKVAVTEGNSGARTNANFTVSLSAPSSDTVSVKYGTSNNTAAASSDYAAAAGTLTFAPGQTSKVVSVVVIGDVIEEVNETFGLTLSSPVNAVLSTTSASATGTINDDDAEPKINISAITSSVLERNGATAPLKFNVSLTNPSNKVITVKYATMPSLSTAVANADYVALPLATLTFQPGETSKVLSVTVKDDALNENNETVGVKIAYATNANVGTATATGVIQDDDAQPSVSVSEAKLLEGDDYSEYMTFEFKLSAPSGKVITFAIASTNGTAVAGEDYGAVELVYLTFQPGETTQTVDVEIFGDTTFENDETFGIKMAAGKNVTLTSNLVKGTIVNDDASVQPTALRETSVNEG